MYNKIKDFIKIGQLQSMFGMNLRNVVLVFIVLECATLFLAECGACVIYFSKLNNIQANGLINETYQILLENSGEYLKCVLVTAL